jgi:hypothetical protein
MDQMIVRMHNPGISGATTSINLRCPACRQRGSFEALPQIPDVRQDLAKDGIVSGQRRCPNSDCQALVFFVFDMEAKKLLVSYPAERIDFDASSIPPKIVGALEEAITCHANGCFFAGAVMVRKTLEELCHERNVQGQNLKEKIPKLLKLGMLPDALAKGVDNLRLLGNDGVHVELKDFDDIGSAEVQAGISFTKKVLEQLYQLDDLVAQLEALKKTSAP